MIEKKRTGPRIGARGAVRLVLACVAAAPLAACVPPASDWSAAQAPKENRVDWVTFDHAVRFPTGATGLTVAERQRLDRFLADLSVQYGDRLFVGTPGTKESPEAERVAGLREAAVVDRLRRLRLRPGPLAPARHAAPWDGAVTITVGRHVVTPPQCPDWSKPATGDPANRVGSNFRCATVTNLGLMVADPADLVRGRPLGPTDGEAAARAIERYREGKVKEPEVVSTQSGGSGGK